MKKRPYVDEFLEEMSKIYELIIFTSSMAEYADRIIDLIDPLKRVSFRLFRENCVLAKNNKIVKYLKDLNRNLKDIILIDVFF